MTSSAYDETDPAPAPQLRSLPADRDDLRGAYRRIEELHAEVHGRAGEDGMKTRVSKLTDGVHRLEQRVEEGFAEVLRAVHANAEPSWWRPLVAVVIVLAVGGLFYAIGVHTWGW